MVNFIIYENNDKRKTIYEITILNFIGIREEEFKIYNYGEKIVNN